MLRDTLIDIANRFGVDNQLRSIRAAFYPIHKHDREDGQKLRLLLRFALTENSNCVEIGAYRGRGLAEMVRLAPHGQHIAYEPQPHLYRNLVDRSPPLMFGRPQYRTKKAKVVSPM